MRGKMVIRGSSLEVEMDFTEVQPTPSILRSSYFLSQIWSMSSK